MSSECSGVTPPRDCMAQFRQIDERLASIQTMLGEIRMANEGQEKRIERAEKTLFGNGHAGLCTKVSAILWLSTVIAGFLAVIIAESFAAWMR